MPTGQHFACCRLPPHPRGALTRRQALALAAVVVGTAPALAEQPHDWQLGMQPAASPVREAIDSLHNELLVIITLITLFVMALLLYAVVRFRASRNPTPSQTTHNTLLEILWTTVPILILVIIAIPSFKLLYYVGSPLSHADMTLKVTGHQWYWSYEYPDNKDISFDSTIVDQKDLKPGQPRLLAVDNPVVVPVGEKIRILVTGTDVIHSWFLPSMGVQEYAIIGRTNEAWMEVLRPGTYYGQCNQICGINHPFMPIEIKAVSKDDFQKWVANPKMRFSENGEPLPVQVAAAARRAQ